MELDLSRPVHSLDGAPPRPASLAMLKKLSIRDEVDLGGWDPADDEDRKRQVDFWRNRQGISTRWSCFSCSDSGYMVNQRRHYSSEVSLLMSVLCVLQYCAEVKQYQHASTSAAAAACLQIYVRKA